MEWHKGVAYWEAVQPVRALEKHSLASSHVCNPDSPTSSRPRTAMDVGSVANYVDVGLPCLTPGMVAAKIYMLLIKSG